jgi:hypothetical protein
VSCCWERTRSEFGASRTHRATALPLLQGDKADVNVELNAKEITDLPLAKDRN